MNANQGKEICANHLLGNANNVRIVHKCARLQYFYEQLLQLHLRPKMSANIIVIEVNQ